MLAASSEVEVKKIKIKDTGKFGSSYATADLIMLQGEEKEDIEIRYPIFDGVHRIMLMVHPDSNKDVSHYLKFKIKKKLEPLLKTYEKISKSKYKNREK